MRPLDICSLFYTIFSEVVISKRYWCYPVAVDVNAANAHDFHAVLMRNVVA